ncbi:MAG: HEPN domain-containing protein [Promethearchaeota archaeon]
MKAYLIHFNREYPKTHDLENLIELLLEFDPEIKIWKENAAILSSYAVSIRYPDFDLPTQGDTKNAVKFSEEMFNYILKKMEEE